MEDLKESTLQGLEELLHKPWIIEMKGVLPMIPLEEIPIQQGQRTWLHPAVEVEELGGRVRQVFQNIQANHCVEPNGRCFGKVAMR